MNILYSTSTMPQFDEIDGEYSDFWSIEDPPHNIVSHIGISFENPDSDLPLKELVSHDFSFQQTQNHQLLDLPQQLQIVEDSMYPQYYLNEGESNLDKSNDDLSVNYFRVKTPTA